MAMHYAEAVDTVERIIYPPTVHIDNEQIKDLKKMELNQKVTLKGKVIEYTTRNPKDGRPTKEIRVQIEDVIKSGKSKDDFE